MLPNSLFADAVDGPSYTREMKRMWWRLAGSVVVLVMLAFLLGLLF